MEDDAMHWLRKRKEFLEEWQRRFKLAQFAVPLIQQDLDHTDWMLNAMTYRPEEADEIPIVGLAKALKLGYRDLRQRLPLPPNYDFLTLINAPVTGTAGTALVYEHVSRVGDMGTPDALDYSNYHKQLYQQLQQRYDREGKVRDLIIALRNPQTLRRFEVAKNSYAKSRSKVGERTSAAMEIRTLIDGVKGDLFSRARRWPKENMTWQTMAERLAIGKQNDSDYDRLQSQGAKHSQLVSRLSQVGKDREGQSLSDVDVLWTEVLDHLYITLGSVDFAKYDSESSIE